MERIGGDLYKVKLRDMYIDMCSIIWSTVFTWCVPSNTIL